MHANKQSAYHTQVIYNNTTHACSTGWHAAPTCGSNIHHKVIHHKVYQCLDRNMRCHNTIADIAYCLYPPLRLYTHIYHMYISFSFHSLISNACHFLLRAARGSNIFFQIMVTLSYISNACHSLSGVAERLQHTSQTTLYVLHTEFNVRFPPSSACLHSSPILHSSSLHSNRRKCAPDICPQRRLPCYSTRRHPN